MMHPFEYQIQQAIHEDRLAAAAQLRFIAEATSSAAEPRLASQALRAAAACLRWWALHIRRDKLEEALTRGSV